MKLNEIISALDAGKRKQKRAAMANLYRLADKGQGKEAIPSLIKLLDQGDDELRAEALAAISQLDEKSHLHLFKKHLNDASARIRGFSACVLSNAGFKPLGYPVLRALLRSSQSSERQWGDLFSSQVPDDFNAEHPSPEELHHIGSTTLGLSTEQASYDASTRICGKLAVQICLCADDSTPSPLQWQAVKLIEKLPENAIDCIRRELGRRLAEKHPEHERGSLELTILGALVPPLKFSRTLYFLLSGDSEYDVEHGFALLFRDGKEFCVCDFDLLGSQHATDDVAAFEEVFRNENVVSVEEPH